ncbi:LOW QUALITY PROTEIN: hypothetical protein SETIT_3G216200v2 [Setaria italica]|uniref:Uncharacterized protein n=1 Tax=Setaria italica TaxID=4555 RepID=A0A368QHG3_SETIT|nr:LOW QUALITY PROTEIN: hypothetical protein SETIT_3G216200v2 [Setaria italica]
MISNWKNVPTTTKDALWATLFTFIEDQKKFAINFAEGLLGRCFKNWRSTLNKEYVQKDKNARNDFSRIPPEMWEEFIQQKNMPEAKALSEENTVKNTHHLGARGYASKIAKWRREEEAQMRVGLPDLFEGLDECSKNWVLARISKVTPNDKVKFKHPTKDEIYARLEQLTEAQKKGRFKPNREKDHLTAAIGTAQHSGRVRRISSTLIWGKAFPNNQATYKKRNRYKKNLEEKMREIAKQELIEFFASQQLATRADPTASDGQRQSSAGSIANMRYPVDDIQVDAPCRLVIPYGRKQNKFREVTTGMVVTGHVFLEEPLPEYAWVQVVMVLDESCKIDIPNDEGIEVLDDVMNQYILCQDVPLLDSNVDTEQPTLSHV